MKSHRPKNASSPKTHWANVAEWYDQLVGDEGSEYHQHVILPGILRLLEIKGKGGEKADRPLAVLDLACGQGVLCRKLAAAGCKVTGLDAATPLIEAAKKRNEADRLAIDYRVADATKLLDDNNRLAAPLGGEAAQSFDAITLVLAVQNMTPLSPIWQGARELLRPNGSLILVMMHPCFRVPKHSDWCWDESTGRQGRVIYEYLTSSKIEIVTHPGLAAAGKAAGQKTTTHFHRPLQAYVNTLGNAGLPMDHMEEWSSHKTSQPGPKKAALDASRKQIPMFLAIRARKEARS
ncbi:MAG: class I SAM-dependent methyltransferase [Phycisphaerales bacterium]|nr:class I SAM-dependent methyltransferase [Phycisphaerales bacterium]